MERTNALRELLESLTTVFTHDRSRLDIQWGEQSAIAPNGWITIAPNVRSAFGRNLSGANELRVLVDILSHEVSHYNHSDLDSKREFMEEYPAFPGVAGAVVNILEDVYVDHQRFKANPGLRRTHAFTIDAMMENHHRRPRIDSVLEDNPAGALIEGALQVAFAGYAKGYSELPDEIQETLAFVRRKARVARNTNDPADRLQLAREVTDRLLSHFPEMDDDSLAELEDLLEELPTDKPEGGWPQPSDEAVEGHNQAVRDGEQGTQTDMGDFDGTNSDLTGEMDDMADQDGDRSSGDWFDADPEEYMDADDSDERRYERLREQVEEERSGLGQRRKERDAAIEEMAEQDQGSWKVAESRTTDLAIEALRESGLDREIAAAFDRLVTQDFEFPDEEGHALNMDAIVAHRAGDHTQRDWYLYEEVAETGDRAIGVALDMSGSMDSVDAKMALGALAVATDTIGDELVAAAFQTNQNYKIKLPLLVAPGETFDWDLTRHVKADGITPTAHGVRDVQRLLGETTKREKVMIVATDGVANVDWSGNDNSAGGMRDAADAVDKARAAGITVIGLGISGVFPEEMEIIFGDGYVMGDDDNLTEALINVYGAQMKTGQVRLR